MKTVIQTLLVLVALCVVGCKKNVNTDTDGPEGPGIDQVEDGMHPRLLLKNSGEAKLKSLVANDTRFKLLHDYIVAKSNDLLNEGVSVFALEGHRLLAVSRQALTRLFYLSYSYRLTGDSRYLDRAEEELLAVCAFDNWNPSHFLDVGEMCMGVAIAYDWLYDGLQDETKIKVRQAIKTKALEPSFTPPYNRFVSLNTNWNSVCHAGLVFGALAISEDEEVLAQAVIDRVYTSNPLALGAYGPDGNYPEGPGYWNYGTAFQVLLLSALEGALGSDGGLSQTVGFMQTGQYMSFAIGPAGYFNYSDATSRIEANPALFWFASKLQDKSLLYQEMSLIDRGVYTAGTEDIERLLPMVLIFGKDIDMRGGTTKPSSLMYVGHGVTPVAMVRTDWEVVGSKYLGIKGGMATSPHAHMDQGTFVYDANSVRWAMDFGLQSYGSLESNGVDLWNIDQVSDRWAIFRYNNLNHNTIAINNQRHKVDGRAEIIDEHRGAREKGVTLDLTPVLNLGNELERATRKAVIVDDSFLLIEDRLEAGANPVSMRWNMVTPAQAQIVDDHRIALTYEGKKMYVEFEGNVPLVPVVRPSASPKDYISEFTGMNYPAYNADNPGTVMIGFNAVIPAGVDAVFKTRLIEEEVQTVLNDNTLVLLGPSPSTASQGDYMYRAKTPFVFRAFGDIAPLETLDWEPFGKTTFGHFFNKRFHFQIAAKRVVDGNEIDAGMDRSLDGQLGVRGGESRGIDAQEGYLVGLDLSQIPASRQMTIRKVAISFLSGSKECTLVNRLNGRSMVVRENTSGVRQNVAITSSLTVSFVDISSLDVKVNGGENLAEVLAVFNTGSVASGSFRIRGFELQTK